MPKLVSSCHFCKEYIFICYDTRFFRFSTWIREYCTKMSSRTARGPVRSYRRRKTVLDFDLNRVPSGENREQEGPSTQLGPQEVQAVQLPQVAQPPTIDVEAIDDDVVESSPRAFAEVCLPSYI